MMDTHGLEPGFIQELIDKAIGMMEYSYAPYSRFTVGAALHTKSGRIYTGCNIENAAYSPGNCAERTAFFKAVSEGEKDFDVLCVVGGMNKKLAGIAQPCGMCRQVMMEFCNPKTFLIILAGSRDYYEIYTLEELLPMAFGPVNLGK